MSKYILLFVFGIFSFSALAQTDVKSSDDYKKNVEIYEQAKKYSDVAVAKMALYNLIAINPTDISLRDSLMYLYFDYNQYAPSLLVALDILKAKPNNMVAKEISAISYENLQLYDKALAAYESLYLNNNNLNTMYKIAFLQFNLKRYQEASTSADIILKNPEAETLNIVFNPTRTTSEQVSMKAAVLNLKGLILQELGSKAEAKQLFQQAIDNAEKFTFAEQNLAEANKQE